MTKIIMNGCNGKMGQVITVLSVRTMNVRLLQALT